MQGIIYFIMDILLRIRKFFFRKEEMSDGEFEDFPDKTTPCLCHDPTHYVIKYFPNPETEKTGVKWGEDNE